MVLSELIILSTTYTLTENPAIRLQAVWISASKSRFLPHLDKKSAKTSPGCIDSSRGFPTCFRVRACFISFADTGFYRSSGSKAEICCKTDGRNRDNGLMGRQLEQRFIVCIIFPYEIHVFLYNLSFSGTILASYASI